MLLSAWLRSSVVSRIFVDFGIESSFEERSYVDLSLSSSVSLNPARDFRLRSQFLDLSGDFSLSLVVFKESAGDFSLISSYSSSDNKVDASLLSYSEFKIFSEASLYARLYKSSKKDFSVYSSFTENIRIENSIKSFVELRRFCDLSISSYIVERYGFFGVSYSIESSFIERPKNFLGYIDTIDGETYTFSTIEIFTSFLYGVSIKVGDLSVSVSNSVDGYIGDGILLTVVSTSDVPDSYYPIASAVSNGEFMELEGVIFDAISLSYIANPLLDFNSNTFTLSIVRDIEDAVYNEFSSYTIPIEVTSYSAERRGVSISLEHIDVNFPLKNSYYYSIISIPRINSSVELYLIDNAAVSFKIIDKPNKFKVDGFILDSAVNGYSMSSSFTAMLSGFYFDDFYLGSSEWTRGVTAECKITNIISVFLLSSDDTALLSIYGSSATTFKYIRVIEDDSFFVSDSIIIGIDFLYDSLYMENKIIEEYRYERIISMYDEVPLIYGEDEGLFDINIEYFSDESFALGFKIKEDITDIDGYAYDAFTISVPDIYYSDYIDGEIYQFSEFIYTDMDYMLYDLDEFIKELSFVPLVSLDDILSSESELTYIDKISLSEFYSGYIKFGVNNFYKFEDDIFNIAECEVV